MAGLTGWADAGEASASAEDSEVTFNFKPEKAGENPPFCGEVFSGITRPLSFHTLALRG